MCMHTFHLPTKYMAGLHGICVIKKYCTVTTPQTADAVDRSAKIPRLIYFARTPGSWNPRCPGFSHGAAPPSFWYWELPWYYWGSNHVITSSSWFLALRYCPKRRCLDSQGSINTISCQQRKNANSDPPGIRPMKGIVSIHLELPRLYHAKSCQPELHAQPELGEFVAPKPNIPSERRKPPRKSYLSWTASWRWALIRDQRNWRFSHGEMCRTREQFCGRYPAWIHWRCHVHACPSL